MLEGGVVGSLTLQSTQERAGTDVVPGTAVAAQKPAPEETRLRLREQESANGAGLLGYQCVL